jgi:UDP-2,3-diacylglucosamine hydrolase
MRKLYIIGDAHLGAQGSDQEELKLGRLISFLKAISREKADLLICGDLFDFWFEYRYVIPRHHYRILALLSELVEAGISIHYIAGNHDFWFGPFMQNDVGMQIHPDDLKLEHGSLKLFIRHGDGLLKNDYLYRLLKKVFRCRLNIFLYRLLHPDLGVPLALSFSTLSRNASKNRPDYSDVEYRQFAYGKIEEGYDLVILGHTHWAALEKHKSGWYLNPGNWMECFTYAVIEQNEPRLFQWDGIQGIEYHPDLPPGNPKSQ